MNTNSESLSEDSLQCRQQEWGTIFSDCRHPPWKNISWGLGNFRCDWASWNEKMSIKKPTSYWILFTTVVTSSREYKTAHQCWLILRRSCNVPVFILCANICFFKLSIHCSSCHKTNTILCLNPAHVLHIHIHVYYTVIYIHLYILCHNAHTFTSLKFYTILYLLENPYIYHHSGWSMVHYSELRPFTWGWFLHSPWFQAHSWIILNLDL